MDGDLGPWTVPVEPKETRRKARPVRAATASAISLGLHALFLAAMVLGLRAVAPPPEAPPIQVQLIPPLPLLQQRSAPARAPPPPTLERHEPRTELRPHFAPPPPVVAPTPPPVALPAPQPKREKAGPLLDESNGDKGWRPTLTGRLGCEDPASFHLNEGQRAVCQNNVGETARRARPLDLDISDENKAAFDHAARCHEAYGRGGIPSATESSGGASIKGLGYVPSLKECPPTDR